MYKLFTVKASASCQNDKLRKCLKNIYKTFNSNIIQLQIIYIIEYTLQSLNKGFEASKVYKT